MKVILALLCLALLAPPTAGAAELSDYLPNGVTYAADVPTPRSVLGFEVGDWHVRHDQLVSYMLRLADASERARIEVIGQTHEQRPLLNLVISSPANLARLDEIFTEHHKLSDPSVEAPDPTRMPVVVYLGYSIHGNEPSGSNASMLTAYHLNAAQGEDIERLLSETVVVIDPSLNPDGLGRFAHWANSHKGQVLVADRHHREHREGWPSGRTNHYWFDLNRDWLLAQHPESQARLEQFHRWRPNVLADFHEMGTDSTYFFQPGVPTRQNPLTPTRNLELTHELAGFHARALDRVGSLYYTEESFDDFYYGKGSTYPDIHGAVGILFEQASSRGHLQESVNGPLAFPFTIKNQFLTSLSTVEGAHARRRELLDYQASFYRSALEQAKDGDLAAYVFGEPSDPARVSHFLELLERHRIEVYELGADLSPAGKGAPAFAAGEAFVVPLAQRQYRLVRALFERRVSFEDSTFYDVSTWTAPLAFDLPTVEVLRKSWRPELVGEPVAVHASGPLARRPQPDLATGDEVVAYAFSWDAYYAPRALYALLSQNLRTRVASRPFTARTSRGEQSFDRGTVVVPVGSQPDRKDLARRLAELARRDAIDVHALTSGLTPTGVDLGSPKVRALELPRPALLIGRGVETYAAGEIWHLLDHRFRMPLPMIEVDDVDDAEISRYSHLILADGNPRRLSKRLGKSGIRTIRRWVEAGGVLVALQGGAIWAEDKLLQDEDEEELADGRRSSDSGNDPGRGEPPERRPYEQAEDDRAAREINGAIFGVDLDLTHPLAFGYRRSTLPVFRNGTDFLEPTEDRYATVAQYTEEPLLSGYVSAANLSRLRQGPAVIAERLEQGAVLRLADGPNFRAFWYGTNKLFLNALFFGKLIEDTSRSP